LTEQESLTTISPDDPASVRAASMQWVQCDSCKGWHHNKCVGLTKEIVDLIDKYHCMLCEPIKGPSTCKSCDAFNIEELFANIYMYIQYCANPAGHVFQ